MSQPKRYSIRGFSAALVEEDNGVMVKWEDYAALKAETVRQIETALPSLEAYIGKLEAEVDCLTKERDHYQWASTNDGIACNERARENQDLENQIAELKAENERLRKITDTIKLLHTFGLDVNAELDKAKSEAAKEVQS